jgi:hypothetical protein
MGCKKSKPPQEQEPPPPPPTPPLTEPPPTETAPEEEDNIDEPVEEEVEPEAEEVPPPEPPEEVEEPPEEEEEVKTEERVVRTSGVTDKEWCPLGTYPEEDGTWVCRIALPETQTTRGIVITYYDWKPKDWKYEDWESNVAPEQPVTGSEHHYRLYNRNKAAVNRIIKKIETLYNIEVSMTDIRDSGKYYDYRQVTFHGPQRETVEAAAYLLLANLKNDSLYVRFGGNMYGQHYEREPDDQEHVIDYKERDQILLRRDERLRRFKETFHYTERPIKANRIGFAVKGGDVNL